jgi:hypothetical protein
MDRLLAVFGQMPDPGDVTVNATVELARGSLLSTYQRNIGSGQTVIIPANDKRLSMTIYNAGLTTLYIGPAQDTSVGAGFPLVAGASYSSDTYRGAIYGLTAGATTDIRIIEESI